MRRVPKPSPAAEPEGLRIYRAENTGATWEQFCGDDRVTKGELAKLLGRVQHGLCAYCEINILDAAPFQIEHFLPKSGDNRRHLDFTNLLACCNGVASQNRLPPYRWYSSYTAKSAHCCGQAKGNKEPGAHFLLDPRTLPLSPRLVKVNATTGFLEAEPAHCAQVGISSTALSATIDLLGLNCARLRFARKTVLDELDEDLNEQGLLQPLGGITDTVLSKYLAPSEKGLLAAFWSVRRYCFDQRADEWIARNAQLFQAP